MTTPIPQPPGVPILGNLFNVDPNNTWASLQKLAEKYGEIFQIKVLGHSIVFVAGAALATEICDEKRFRKYVGGPIVEIRYAVNDALFTAFDHEASWAIAHRIIAPKLSTAAVVEMFDEMRDVSLELVDKWRGLVVNNDLLPLKELNRLNLEATTLTLYGKKLDCLTDTVEHPMLQAMEDATSEAMKRPTRPGFVNWLLYGGKFKRGTKAMRDYAAEIVKYRRANQTDRQDVLWALLNAKDPETSTGLTESQVIDEIVSMPIGSSTAPCLLSTAIFLLLRNPHVIARVREELDSVIGDGPFMHSHLSKLKYTEAVLREGLRLSFAAPGFNIEPIPRADQKDKSPVPIGGGKYQVAHNQAIIIVLAGVNRDPTVFEEPLAFKPERMMGPEFDKLPLGVKRWFGNGKRECIGKHWAWQFSIVALAILLKEVDFDEVDPNYELKQDGWFNYRPIHFRVRVEPRKK